LFYRNLPGLNTSVILSFQPLMNFFSFSIIPHTLLEQNNIFEALKKYHIQMKTNKPIIIILLLLIFAFNNLFSQKLKITVDAGINQSIYCGDTITLTASVSNWVNLGANINSYSPYFNKVLFINPKKGFLIDNNGTVYKTLDGGINWQSIKILESNSLNHIFFVGEQIGYITESSGKILKTTDGGNTWTNSKVNFFSNAIFFLNKDAGYISTDYGHIMKTIDGGLTWEKINQEILPSFNKIFFLNDTVAVGSSGNGIMKTYDGGKTWKVVSQLASYDLCQDGANAFYAISNNKAICKSIDYGETWEKMNTGLQNDYKLISFSSKDSAIMVGDQGRIAETYDAGKTWKVLNYAGNSNLNCVFAKNKTQIIVGSNGLVLKSFELGTLNYDWSSSDLQNIESLQRIKVSPRIKTSYKVKVSNDLFEGTDSVEFEIDFKINAGADKIINCGDSSMILGKLSEFRKLNSFTNFDLDFNYFKNDSTGFAVGYGIYKTTDYGKSWQIINVGGFDFSTGICFADSSTGFISDLGGRILKSIDGGNTWFQIYGGISETLYGIYFINNATGFVYGSHSTIYKTTDAGITWQSTTTDKSTSLLTMDFINNSIGFAAGDSGLVLKTENGGESWQRINLTTKKDIVSLAFYDESNGIMVGTKGLILRTEDGGKNWKEINSGRETTFSVVYYLNKNEVYAMGDEIIYSNDSGQTWQSLNTPQKNYIYSACTINGKVYTVGRQGEMIVFKPYKNITYSWSSSNYPIQTNSSSFIIKPKTNSTFIVTANSNAGCVSSDTVSISIKGLNINAYAYWNKVTCGDSTFLTSNSWSQYNTGFSSNIESISFINSDTGYISYGGYSYAKTTNGGNSWQQFYSNNYLNISSLSFCSTSKGYATEKDNRKLYKTEDGGKNWNQTGLSGFRKVLFISSKIGLLIGDSGKIMRTIDGGIFWNKINSPINESLNSIDNFNGKLLVIKSDSSNYLLSKNEGLTWQKINNPANEKPIFLYLIDEKTGYAINKDRSIFYTNNGGTSWTLKSKTNLNIGSLFFIDEQKGFALDISNYQILETIDGGTTWFKTKDISKMILNFCFPEAQTIYALGYNGFYYKYNLSQFKNINWYSNDGFLSSKFPMVTVQPKETTNYYIKAWGDGDCYATDSAIIQVDPLVISAGKDIEVFPGDSVELFSSVGNGNGKWEVTYTDFKRIKFINRNIGFALNKTNDLYKTKDGGKNWIFVSNQYGTIDFCFLDENTGYLAGSEIKKTTDGGKTWIIQNLGATASKVLFTNKRNGFIITTNNYYFETNDYGRSWQNIKTGNYYIKDMFFRNELSGYAITRSDYKILTTNDGGKNWKEQNTLLNSNPFTICFTDSLHGYYGYYGIYKTDDAGKSWKEVLKTSSQSIDHIYFVNKNRGYGLTSNGEIYKTMDGGETWNLDMNLYSNYNYYSKDIQFPDEDHGYICLDNGTFAKYTEPLDCSVKWEPVQDFTNPFQPIQKIKVNASKKYFLKATSGIACQAIDSIMVMAKDISKLILLQKIDIVETNVVLDPGEFIALNVLLYPQNAYNIDIRFYSADTTIASIDNLGKVTGNNGGETYVYALSPDGKIQDFCKIKVNYRLTGIKIYPEYSGLMIGNSTELEIEFLPDQALHKEYNCSSSNPSVAFIIEKNSNSIVLKGLQEGYTDIRVVSPDGKLSSTARVFVGPLLSKIDIIKTEIDIPKLKMEKLGISTKPSNLPYYYFYWLSSDTTIVTVDSIGKIYSKNIGKATVVCFYIFDPYKFDTCNINVIDIPIDNPFKIFPNPFQDYIIIEPDKSSFITEVKIFKLNGEMVLNKRLTIEREKIYLQNLSQGTYILELTSDLSKEKFKIKIIKM